MHAIICVDPDAHGVVIGPSGAKTFTRALIDAIGWNRHWERVV